MEGVFDQLTDYVAFAHLWHSLEKTHLNDEVNYLMVRMVEIEETILAHFGLPLTFNYSELFQELGIKNDFKLSDIPVFIKELEYEANKYFNLPVLSDIELLRKAQKLESDIDYVLPELTLKLLAEPYYNFCYYFLFIQKKITPDLFLEELKCVVKNDCSIRLSNLVNKRLLNYKEDTEYLLLEKLDLQFLDVFMENYHIFDNNRLDYLGNELPF